MFHLEQCSVVKKVSKLDSIQVCNRVLPRLATRLSSDFWQSGRLPGVVSNDWHVSQSVTPLASPWLTL